MWPSEPDAAPVRLIVRRVPGSQLALFATYSYHGFMGPWNWRLTTAAMPRSRMRYATSSTASG